MVRKTAAIANGFRSTDVNEPPCRVSCLTVSHRARYHQLRDAMADFSRQSHPLRELIIVVDDLAYAQRIENLARSSPNSIYIVSVSETLPLGALRNLSMDHAHGEVCCQWDDDDRYSAARIALQLGALRDFATHACFLFQQLHFFSQTRELFWTDWRVQDGRPVQAAGGRVIPGTILYRGSQARYPEQGAWSVRGEDSIFAAEIGRSGAVGIESPPGTYLRNYHGNNSWEFSHHRALAVRRSSSLEVIQKARSSIEAALRSFEIEPPVAVMAADKIAFQYR